MDSTSTQVRLVVLAHHPVQYHSPLYRELNDQKELDVKVIYLDTVGLDGTVDREFGQPMQWDVPLLEGYNYNFLKNISPFRMRGFLSRINLGLLSTKWTDGVDVVLLQGYSIFSNWIALYVAKQRNIKIIWRGEAVLKESDKRKSIRSQLKKKLIVTFFSKCDAYMYSCSGNKNYLRFFGILDEEMFALPCAVDNQFFRRGYQKYRLKREAIRTQLGISDEDLVILFCARLTKRKKPLDLIEAVNKLKKKNGVTLLFVGDGPEMKVSKELVQQYSIKGIFVGFKNQSELAKYYSIADVAAVISSYDPSPKTLNEVMNFDLPVIVTDVVGTATDLVKDGRNGFVVTAGDIGEMSKAIQILIEGPARRKEMGRKSGEIVKGFDMLTGARGIVKAVASVAKQ